MARCGPLSLRRRRIWSTSPARPRRRMSAAPTPSSRSRAANRFSFHGADSTTRSVRAKGVAICWSAVRKAIRGSIFRAPSSRARSSTSPALVTAGLGSSRYAPGSLDVDGIGPGAGLGGLGGRGGRAGQRVAGRQDRGAPLGGRERRRPQHGFLEVAAVGDELGLPARRDQLGGQAGRGLDADGGDLAGEGEAPVERRLRHPGGEPARPGPAGRVDEDRVDAVQCDVAHVRDAGADPAGFSVDAGVVDGEPGVDLVAVDGEHDLR